MIPNRTSCGMLTIWEIESQSIPPLRPRSFYLSLFLWAILTRALFSPHPTVHQRPRSDKSGARCTKDERREYLVYLRHPCPGC